MDEIISVVQVVIKIDVYLCYFYVGELVYIVFFGSYQDVICKCLIKCNKDDFWDVVYLFIDLLDLGCSYEVVVWINS